MAASARIEAATRAAWSSAVRRRRAAAAAGGRPTELRPGVHDVAAQGVGRLELLAGDAHEVLERQAHAEQGEHVAHEAHVGVAVAVAVLQVVGPQQARRLQGPQHLDRHAAALGHLGQPQHLVLLDQRQTGPRARLVERLGDHAQREAPLLEVADVEQALAVVGPVPGHPALVAGRRQQALRLVRAQELAR